MAKVKATTTDVYAKLARGECANFRNGCCQGRTPCTIIIGEACDYFNAYVQPLLEYGEFADKYRREAKISVALKPKTKVIRKSRAHTENSLTQYVVATPVAKAPPVITKREVPVAPKKEVKRVQPAAIKKEQSPITTVVNVSGEVTTKPALPQLMPMTALSPLHPQLSLELTPDLTPGQRKHRRSGVRR